MCQFKDIFIEPSNLSHIKIIGIGSVYKLVWRGIIVAAKEVPVIGNEKFLKKELKVYRYILSNCVYDHKYVDVHVGVCSIVITWCEYFWRMYYINYELC